MNLIDKMNRIDKQQQVNELIHCKVSHFKDDLIRQIRNLLEEDELIQNGKHLELNLNELNNQRSINKRKFSSSEDEEQDKLDSNSNSLESNDKSDSHEQPLNLNKILNNLIQTNDQVRVKCNENLIDSHDLIKNSLTNSFNHLHSPISSSESIEKSFNETISCLNGVSVQLIGNIKLQLSQKNSTSSLNHTSSKMDKINHQMTNNNLLIIDQTDLQAKEIDLESKEEQFKSKNFNIDKLIKDENKFTFGMFNTNKSKDQLNKDQVNRRQLLINQQLSASTDSSSSTLSAVSIDLTINNKDNSQQQIEHSRRRSSDSITTASACSDLDCLSPPNRKHLKTDNSLALNLVNSMNKSSKTNSSINLDLQPPFISLPPLPQQAQQSNNDLLSPINTDQTTYKTKKSHLKSISNDRSPNYHKKFNPIQNPLVSPKSIGNTTIVKSNASSGTNHHMNHNQINNPTKKSTPAENALNPKIKKILKSCQEMANNSLNGPEYYENLAMLANFHQRYNLKTLDPVTARIANAASSFLNGHGPVPDAQLLMNELTKLQLNRSEDAKSEIANLSINNLDNYLTKKSELIENKLTSTLHTKKSLDSENGKLTTTILENERISCFNVGGEQRLCLPQILTTVLRTFSLHDINNVCDQFQIFCSRCNTEQLNMLKAAHILPPGAPSCGLITKSDAERLCAMLFFYANLFPSQVQAKVRDPYSFYAEVTKPEQPLPEEINPKLKSELKESKLILDLVKELSDEIRSLVYEDHPLNRLQKIQALKTTLSFKVEHHCFGKCKGLLIPAFYLRYNSRCIMCLECESLLTPNKFVCHTHKFNENQTCHWGFDSSNWRNLITLTKDDSNNPKMSMLKKYLTEFKFHKIV